MVCLAVNRYVKSMRSRVILRQLFVGGVTIYAFLGRAVAMMMSVAAAVWNFEIVYWNV
jgi:hypothetical protein